MKKVVIVHCWDGDPGYCWYPYVKRELEMRGFAVKIPFLPDLLPLLSRWLGKIKKAIGEPDENTILIGHSLGCITLLRYLEELPENAKVGGVVLVAGFISDLGFRPLYNFFSEPLDFRKIRQRAGNIVLIASDNDPFVKPFHAGILREQLNARIIWKSGGHFTETLDGIPYREFPEVVSAVEKLSQQKANYQPEQEPMLNKPAYGGLTV
jgi:uncharacterized protein